MAFSRTVATTHTKTLIAPSSGSADKVYGSDYVSASSHTATPAVTDATSGGIPYFSSTTAEASSALLAQYGVVIGGGAGAAPATQSGLTFGGAAAGTGLAIAAGTATTDEAALRVTRTNNNAAVATGVKFAFTDTTSATDAYFLQVLAGASATTNIFSVQKRWLATGLPMFVNGTGSDYTLSIGWQTQQVTTRSDGTFGWSAGTNASVGNDTAISRISAGIIGVGTGAAGSFAGRIKLTSAIAAGVTVANLNAAPTTGEIQSVTDSLAPVAGAAVAAGGAAKALVWYNGAQWTVVAV